MADNKNRDLLFEIGAKVAASLIANNNVAVEQKDKSTVTSTVAQVIASDPVAKNALNMEGFLQSRIYIGLLVTVAGIVLKPLGVVFPENIAEWIDAGAVLVSLGGVGYAAYGRYFGSTLPPLRS